MNDSDFGNNFTWYEWGFVSPEQFPSNGNGNGKDASSSHDTEGYSFAAASYEVWDEDNRWMT